MYYIGIGNDRINETKINTSSQWKQYDLGPRSPPFFRFI